MANKKDSKVRDLKVKKDVKGGGPGIHHTNPPIERGGHGPVHTQGGGPSHAQGGGPRQGA